LPSRFVLFSSSSSSSLCCVGHLSWRAVSEAGFSSFQVGMLMSATAFPSVVISPISGVLIDKIGTQYSHAPHACSLSSHLISSLISLSVCVCGVVCCVSRI
jgi:MFS family permease